MPTYRSHNVTVFPSLSLSLSFVVSGTHFDADRGGREGLQILRVEQVAAVSRQHLNDPDGKPFGLATRMCGGRTGRGP